MEARKIVEATVVAPCDLLDKTNDKLFLVQPFRYRLNKKESLFFGMRGTNS